ncbi:Poly [ADP-ribose] polymerase [Aphelenchoides besseyi]|nr:Poly [ADP-ribose] polymerase [Aphelenchoides besseyi]KAI6232312.1 Poly [ADP-ribose] polymerase [Aphelenchoides besseyi]
MPPKRRAAAKKKTATTSTAQPTSSSPPPDEHEAKKRKISEALNKSSVNELPDVIEPDEKCPVKGLTVYIDRENHIAYDVMLNQSNIDNNNNKFFILQILAPKNPVADSYYYTWFRWGRVGYDGQHHIESGALQSMISSFEKKFKDKTGNSFADRNNFVKKAKKYDLIELNYADDETIETEEGIKKKKSVDVPSKLDDRVKGAIDLICDMSAMERQLKAMNFDSKKTPLGKLTKAQIQSGFKILAEIEECLKNGDHSRLSELSSAFYTKIPHNWGMTTPLVLSQPMMVRAELDLLETLAEVQIAAEAMKEENTEVEKKHPSDINYERLNCPLKPLDKDHKNYKLAEQYLTNTQGRTHHLNLKLLNVFEIDRPGESDVFKDDLENQTLLWHGSRISNWFGILYKGLKIAPPEAPSTGYMFGKGIYFADCVSKSANYCYAYRERCFMTLAQVALGNMRPLKDADYEASNLPEGFHSTMGVGRQYPNEENTETLQFGDGHNVKVPCGKLVERKDEECCLEYNEYIVYDTSQIRLRLLLEIEFS